jgi:prophage regulatory protein
MPTSKTRSANVAPTAPSAPTGHIRILRLAQVLEVTGLGKTKIYELQSEGSFPMRVQITAHSVGWVEGDVQAWLAKRVAISASLLRASFR